MSLIWLSPQRGAFLLFLRFICPNTLFFGGPLIYHLVISTSAFRLRYRALQTSQTEKSSKTKFQGVEVEDEDRFYFRPAAQELEGKITRTTTTSSSMRRSTTVDDEPEMKDKEQASEDDFHFWTAIVKKCSSSSIPGQVEDLLGDESSGTSTATRSRRWADLQDDEDDWISQLPTSSSCPPRGQNINHVHDADAQQGHMNDKDAPDRSATSFLPTVPGEVACPTTSSRGNKAGCGRGNNRNKSPSRHSNHDKSCTSSGKHGRRKNPNLLSIEDSFSWFRGQLSLEDFEQQLLKQRTAPFRGQDVASAALENKTSRSSYSTSGSRSSAPESQRFENDTENARRAKKMKDGPVRPQQHSGRRRHGEEVDIKTTETTSARLLSSKASTKPPKPKWRVEKQHRQLQKQNGEDIANIRCALGKQKVVASTLPSSRGTLLFDRFARRNGMLSSMSTGKVNDPTSFNFKTQNIKGSERKLFQDETISETPNNTNTADRILVDKLKTTQQLNRDQVEDFEHQRSLNFSEFFETTSSYPSCGCSDEKHENDTEDQQPQLFLSCREVEMEKDTGVAVAEAPPEEDCALHTVTHTGEEKPPEQVLLEKEKTTSVAQDEEEDSGARSRSSQLQEELPPPPEELFVDGGWIPSLGSKLHGTGNCKPCHWFWKYDKRTNTGIGCRNEWLCNHCHSCPEGQEKQEILRKRKAQKAQAQRSRRENEEFLSEEGRRPDNREAERKGDHQPQPFLSCREEEIMENDTVAKAPGAAAALPRTGNHGGEEEPEHVLLEEERKASVAQDDFEDSGALSRVAQLGQEELPPRPEELFVDGGWIPSLGSKLDDAGNCKPCHRFCETPNDNQKTNTGTRTRRRKKTRRKHQESFVLEEGKRLEDNKAEMNTESSDDDELLDPALSGNKRSTIVHQTQRKEQPPQKQQQFLVSRNEERQRPTEEEVKNRIPAAERKDVISLMAESTVHVVKNHPAPNPILSRKTGVRKEIENQKLDALQKSEKKPNVSTSPSISTSASGSGPTRTDNMLNTILSNQMTLQHLNQQILISQAATIHNYFLATHYRWLANLNRAHSATTGSVQFAGGPSICSNLQQLCGPPPQNVQQQLVPGTGCLIPLPGLGTVVPVVVAPPAVEGAAACVVGAAGHEEHVGAAPGR